MERRGQRPTRKESIMENSGNGRLGVRIFTLPSDREGEFWLEVVLLEGDYMLDADRVLISKELFRDER